MSDEKTYYKVEVTKLDWLEEQIAKLNKKAGKLRCQPVTLTYHGEETKEFTAEHSLFEYTRTFKIVSVEGATPKLDGWRLIAAVEKLESGENMVSCVPNETVPNEFRNTDAHCDHCHRDRRRKEVFLLKHDDGCIVQVGRQCIADFLGGKSPEAILNHASWMFSLDQLFSEAGDEDFWGHEGRGEQTYNIEEFVKMTAAVIRRMGWVSRKTASEQLREADATVSHVTWLLNPSFSANDAALKKQFINRNNIVLEERDAELATAALTWGVALATDDSEYLYNLGVACRLGFVRQKTTGLVASLVSAYQRKLDKEAELHIERAKKDRKHLGIIGERTHFTGVTVKSIRSFDGDWGVRTMIRFEDADGSVLVFWKSGDTDWEEGETLDITATVKKHEDWKGIPQTVIQRATKGLSKLKKKRAA